jgi:plastocyanin
VVAALAIGLLFPTDSLAAAPRIAMLNFVFAPDPAYPRIGQTVIWWNERNNRSTHNTTDSSPLLLWQSPDLLGGETFTYTFTAAGTYLYECTLHDFFGMVGSIRVPDSASPPNGPAGTIFTITVASVDAPTGMVYDIQEKDPGGSFRNWILGTTLRTAEFDSTGRPIGTYRFRSRLRRVSDNGTIGFSPAVSIEVTG